LTTWCARPGRHRATPALDLAPGFRVYRVVMGFLISELADSAAVPVSTVRYYERIGLLRPPKRQNNGYRVYDGTAEEHLAFIGRAKRMGIPLEQVSELLELWTAGGCRPMQKQIRELLAGRVGEVRTQRKELAAFGQQLEGLLARIDGGAGEDRLCELDCDCVHLEDADPLAGCARFPTVAREAEVGCTLDGGDRAKRVTEWRDLLESGRVEARTPTGLRAVFSRSVETAERLAGLCAAETACCSFFTFRLEIDARTLVLLVEVPDRPDARELADHVFGPPEAKR
jgi:MerR family transcriptional regulator, copper efflux regulator